MFVLILCARGSAQPAAPAKPKPEASAPAPNPADDEDEVEVAEDSPRASLAEYLRLVHRGRYVEAAAFLDLRPDEAAKKAELARDLWLVLDRRLPLELDDVSPRSEGDSRDGLRPNVEELGKIKRPHAAAEPVRMVKHANAERWQFSRSTVSRIESWYAQLDNHLLLDRMPPALLRPFAFDLALYQWLALPLVLFVAFGAAFLLSSLTRRAFAPLVKHSPRRWPEAALDAAHGPLIGAWALVIGYVLSGFLGLPEQAASFVERLMRGGLLALLFWTLSRAIGMVERVGTHKAWLGGRRALVTLIPLGSRVGRVAVFILAIVALISELGYPVASVLAGLGIGGLAVALAGQKTLENLFGAFAIGTDQPFREGDAIKLGDVSGTVERVGLRSTRLRTGDRTLVSVPNGKLAEMTIESLAERDRTVLACKLRLDYATRASQLREVLQRIEQALRAETKLLRDGQSVKLTELAEACLVIDVGAHSATDDPAEFAAVREELYLQFLEIVERAGAHFAFPARTAIVTASETSSKAEASTSAATPPVEASDRKDSRPH